MSVGIFDADRSLQFITNSGAVKKSSLDNFQTSYSKLQAIKLKKMI